MMADFIWWHTLIHIWFWNIWERWLSVTIVKEEKSFTVFKWQKHDSSIWNNLCKRKVSMRTPCCIQYKKKKKLQERSMNNPPHSIKNADGIIKMKHIYESERMIMGRKKPTIKTKHNEMIDPLHKWHPHLNNNTWYRTSLASHSWEKSFVLKHKHEAKSV